MINNYDPDIQVEEPKLQICKNNLERTVIGNVKEAYNINRKQRLGNVSELSFDIPFETFYRNTKRKNNNEPELKERRIIKYTEGYETEYFIIHKITKSMNDSSDAKRIECYSLAYELSYKLVHDFSVVSYNATQSLSPILIGTGWEIGYIDADFDLLYRSFDISSSTVLDAIQQIAETFNALIVYDTINRTVSFYDFEKYGQYKGLKAKYGKLLKSITYETNMAEYCSRLILRGKDGTDIRSVNPTGANYIEDFSSLLYGFKRNPDKTVISSASDISDDLANALLDYQELVESKQHEFSVLLSNREVKNQQLITARGELATLQSELVVIENSISTENANNGDPTPYISQKTAKLSEIQSKQNEINTYESQLETVEIQIHEISILLSVENNFTENQIKEWQPHIVVKEWSNQYIDDPQQLYEAGKEELAKMREPKIVVNIDIVDLRKVLTEQHNWDKLVLGDIMRIEVEKLGIEVDAKILEIDTDHENANVRLTIGNVKEILSDEERFMKNMYNTISSSTTFNNNQFKYLDGFSKANETYQMLMDKLDATKIRIEGSFDESVTITNQGLRATSPSNPDDVLILQSGVLAVSNTGGDYWNTAVDASGVYAERLHGIIGQFATLRANQIVAGDNGETIGDNLIQSSSAWNNAATQAGNSVQLGTAYNNTTITAGSGVVSTRSDNKSRSIMSGSGFAIQKNEGSVSNPSWVNKVYADSNGDVIVDGTVHARDVIVGGSSVLTQDKLKINGDFINRIKVEQLDATTAKIQTAQIEDLVVGGNVTMGANASLSWSQISNKPYIPSVPNYIQSTYIDSTNVISPNITGGVLTGSVINNGNGTFTVDEDGHMTATSGAFSGTITSSNISTGVAGSSMVELKSFLADINLYHLGDHLFQIRDNTTDVRLWSPDQYNIHLGHVTNTVYCEGNWDFGGANVTNLYARFA